MNKKTEKLLDKVLAEEFDTPTPILYSYRSKFYDSYEEMEQENPDFEFIEVTTFQDSANNVKRYIRGPRRNDGR